MSKLLITIEGSQQSGKTTLLDKLIEEKPFEFKSYKFPFGNVVKTFNIKENKDALLYLSMGKDISLLSLNNAFNQNELWISDRGPISSLYYNIIDNRTSLKENEDYAEFLKSNFDNWIPIWIIPLNRDILKRDKNDDFNDIEKSNHEYDDALNWIITRIPNMVYFENDFSLGSDVSYKDFLNLLRRVRGII